MADLENKLRRRELVKSHLLDEHLIAIGHIAIRSAVLDLMIESVASEMTNGYPAIMRAKALNLPTVEKLDLVAQILTKELPHSEHAIAEFIAEVREARSRRNDVIHRVWASTESDEEKLLIDPTTWRKPKMSRTVTAKMMMDLATKLIDLMFELSDWKMVVFYTHMRKDVSKNELKATSPREPPRTSEKDGKKARKPEDMSIWGKSSV